MTLAISFKCWLNLAKFDHHTYDTPYIAFLNFSQSMPHEHPTQTSTTCAYPIQTQRAIDSASLRPETSNLS